MTWYNQTPAQYASYLEYMARCNDSTVENNKNMLRMIQQNPALDTGTWYKKSEELADRIRSYTAAAIRLRASAKLFLESTEARAGYVFNPLSDPTISKADEDWLVAQITTNQPIDGFKKGRYECEENE